MIESKKAESGIYSPCAGRLVRINPEVLSDPSVINVDKYGDGWLFELQPSEVELLSPQEYVVHLGKAWDVAQKTIKGQANTE
jgi:glycine cleavage system H protein